MNPVRIIFLPADIWRGVQAMGLVPEEVAKCSDKFVTSFSDQDMAAMYGLQNLPAVKQAFGCSGDLDVNCNSNYFFNRWSQIVRPLADSSYIQERVLAGISGPYKPEDPPIKVVDLGPAAIGVVLGQGTLEALSKDNTVLAALETVMQKALVYGTVEDLMKSYCSGFVSRYVMVNSFASTYRPPSPVYR